MSHIIIGSENTQASASNMVGGEWCVQPNGDIVGKSDCSNYWIRLYNSGSIDVFDDEDEATFGSNLVQVDLEITVKSKGAS